MFPFSETFTKELYCTEVQVGTSVNGAMAIKRQAMPPEGRGKSKRKAEGNAMEIGSVVAKSEAKEKL